MAGGRMPVIGMFLQRITECLRGELTVAFDGMLSRRDRESPLVQAGRERFACAVPVESAAQSLRTAHQQSALEQTLRVDRDVVALRRQRAAECRNLAPDLNVQQPAAPAPHATGMTLRTAGCSLGSAAKLSSTTQSICAPG